MANTIDCDRRRSPSSKRIAHEARPSPMSDVPPSSVPSTNERLRWASAVAASSSVPAMNSASSVSGNTVIAEPLKIVSPMRSPLQPGGELGELPQHDGVELVHRGRHVEAEHDVPVADVALHLAIGRRTHRQPDSRQPDDRQARRPRRRAAGGSAAATGGTERMPRRGERWRSRHRHAPGTSRRRRRDVHSTTCSDGNGCHRADETDPRLQHHHGSASSPRSLDRHDEPPSDGH